MPQGPGETALGRRRNCSVLTPVPTPRLARRHVCGSSCGRRDARDDVQPPALRMTSGEMLLRSCLGGTRGSVWGSAPGTLTVTDLWQGLLKPVLRSWRPESLPAEPEERSRPAALLCRPVLCQLRQGARSGAGLDNLGPQTRMLPALAPGLPTASREAGSQPHHCGLGLPAPPVQACSGKLVSA